MPAKITYVAIPDVLTIEVSEESLVKAFDTFASAYEVFSKGASRCTNCNEMKPIYTKRGKDDMNFREIKCGNCGYVRELGTHKIGGTMFAKQWKPPYEPSQAPRPEPQSDHGAF